VVAEESFLRHALNGHLIPERRPWEQWLGPELYERLQQVTTGRLAGAELLQALEDFAAALGASVRWALERPLVLKYFQGESSEDPKRDHMHWTLPTAAGLVIHLRSDSVLRFVTCYVPTVSRAGAAYYAGWRSVVEHLVVRYCPYEPGVGFLVPDGDRQVIVRGTDPYDPRKRRHAFQFVTLASWGFTEDELGALRWDGGALGGPEPPGAVEALTHTLKPRRIQPIGTRS
jgi:hypothetical protein